MYKEMWENLKSIITHRTHSAGFSGVYSEVYDLMSSLEPKEFYFLICDANEDKSPWFVGYAGKRNGEWRVDLRKEGWSPVPTRYNTPEEARSSLSHVIGVGTIDRVLTTSGHPSQEELLSFVASV